MNKRHRSIAGGLALGLFATCVGGAQTLTTGDIVGKITDPTGAALAGVTVTLTSLDQGTTQNVKTDASGGYRFSLLRPGSYSVAESEMNLSAKAGKVEVSVGQATTVDLEARPNGDTVAVEVLATQPLVQVEDANITTTLSQAQMQELPLAGADLSSAALTAPGAVMSTGGGLTSNFFIFGLPGTGNLFVLNGADLMDPYYNVNNSGASNNSLGVNEIQETSIVANGYTGQYGRLPGANLNFTTQSGSNQFHGNALYQYNGSFLNSRDWFVAHNALPGDIAGDRPRTIANQWGGSFGGPIIKNKLFGFFDEEGLNYVSAAPATPIYLPTQAFETAVLANIAATQPSETSYYQSLFGLYNNANGASRAQALTAASDPTLGCADFAGTVNGTLFGPNGQACTRVFNSTNNNLNTEQLYAIRIDQNFRERDKAFYRFHHDWGVQATSTDPINTAFSANSIQPEWDGQFNESHIVSPNIVNNFTAAGSYYKAIFGPPNYAAAISTFPTTITFSQGNLQQLGGTDYNFPSGRNVAQYQFVDDLSVTRGKNNMKMGVNFRRNNFALFSNQAYATGLTTIGSTADLINGTIGAQSSVQYNFPTTGAGEMRFYSLGLYFQDQLAATDRLKLTLSLRADRNSNPVCKQSCYARLAAPFYDLNKGVTIPYNQSILSGQANPYNSVESVNLQPRLGFAYTPAGSSGRTVIRGGVGSFIDSPMLAAVSRFFTAAPLDPAFVIQGTGSQTIYAGAPGSAYSQALASNNAFQTGFHGGATLAQIQSAVAATGSRFSAPSYSASVVNELKNPTYIEYNLELQRQFSRSDAFDLNYVGNYGFDILFQDGTANGASASGFAGLPTTRPDPRFSYVTTLTNRAHSNYNGITGSYQHQVGAGLTASFNYTFSKTMGTVSNGGLYGPNAGIQTDSVLQYDPRSPSRLNYGPLDYDVRHNINANYVWQVPTPAKGLLAREVLGGWTISGVVFYKTGMPYTVYNTSVKSAAVGTSINGVVLAAFLNGSKNAPCNNPNNVCLQPSQFARTLAAQAPYGFGNLASNSFRGPHFFDTDLRLIKSIRFYEKYSLRFGATASNVLNHPNFATPVNNAASGTFGKITQTVVSSPSSLYGNGQGSSPSGRVLALNAGISF